MIRIQQVHHVSLLVSDLVRARQFYEGILGMAPDISRPAMRFDGVWYSPGSVQIHLLCLPDPAAGVALPEHGGRDRHLALLVNDTGALADAFVRNGISFTTSSSGRAALFCRDPDGNALEFIQAPVPAEQGC